MTDGDEPIPLDAETREVIKHLRAAASRARQLILKPPGKTDTARSWHASRAAARLKGINAELDAIKGKLADVAGKKIQGAYRDGVKAAEQQAREAGVQSEGSAFKGGFSVVDRRRTQVLVKQTVGDFSKAVDSIKATTGKIVRQTQALNLDSADVNRLLAGGALDGDPKGTLRELKKLIKAAAIDGRIVTVNRSTGVAMDFEPGYYAELVYQTKMAETTNIATVTRLQAKKIYHVKILGSNSRNFCTAFVGRVFYTGEGTDPHGFPHISRLPRGGAPFHPRCTKRYTAFVVALQTPEAIEDARLRLHERVLLDKEPGEAQKAFKKATKPAPTPAAAPDRQAEVTALARDARRQLREIEAGYNQREASISRWRVDLAEQIKQSFDKPEILDTLKPEYERVSQEHRALTQQRRESGLAILRVDKPVGINATLSSSLGPVRRQAVLDGLDGFRQLVDQSLVERVNVVARPPERKHVAGGRSYYRDGKIFMAKSAPPRVVVHEMGHLLEDASPQLHDAVLKFYDRRTAGEKLQSLRLLTRLDYKPHEMTRPDDWFNPYVGKDYGGRFTEVVSMALESIYADPFKLASIDPEFFEFIFKAVRGVFE